ncbi:protein rolling stone-like [Amphiura filiformis]|uniref:protein rolling stone-like n=1 Tax=Amphiura filiformis TaxID=82378 RepID=UPI003B21835C
MLFTKWGTTPYYPKASDSRWKMFLFASNWAYITVCLYFTFAAISTFTYHMRTSYKDTSFKANKEELEINNLIEAGGTDPNKEYILPVYVKFTWYLKSSIYPAIILTSFLRWGADTGEPYQYSTNAVDVHVHGVGLAFVIVDFILISSPYRLQHVIYPMTAALGYYMFTLIYFFAGGTNGHHANREIDGDTYLYREKLDWGRFPRTTVFIAFMMLFVAIPLTHLFIYLLFKLKQLMIEWYYFNKHKR